MSNLNQLQQQIVSEAVKEFREKWSGGDDGLFITPAAGTDELQNKLESFLTTTLNQATRKVAEEMMDVGFAGQPYDRNPHVIYYELMRWLNQDSDREEHGPDYVDENGVPRRDFGRWINRD